MEDHQKLVQRRREDRPDLNKYDLKPRLRAAYPMSQRGMGTGLPGGLGRRITRTNTWKRCCAGWWRSGAPASNAILFATWFNGAIDIEEIHPLESGLFRFKFRRDRRPGLPIEPRWKFYPKYAVESVVKMGRWFKLCGGFAGSMSGSSATRRSGNTWIWP